MTSGSVYNADLYCAACTDEIKDSICEDLFKNAGSSVSNGTIGRDWLARLLDGYDYASTVDIRNILDSEDQSAYDSGDYPKDCDVSSESDCPQHCGGCGEFLENDLTTDGIDYVREAVRDCIRNGWDNCDALRVWMPYYSWIDFGEVGACDVCGRLREDLDCNDECGDCRCDDEDE